MVERRGARLPHLEPGRVGLNMSAARSSPNRRHGPREGEPQALSRAPFIGAWADAKAAGAKTYYSGRPCSKGHTDGRWVNNRYCLICHKESQRQNYRANNVHYLEKHKHWRAANKDKTRDRSRRYNYGIEPGEWERIFNEQGRCCALCKTVVPGCKRGWSTDHCHKSERVRGILCLQCNLALGFYERRILPIADQVRAYLESDRAV